MGFLPTVSLIPLEIATKKALYSKLGCPAGEPARQDFRNNRGLKSYRNQVAGTAGPFRKSFRKWLWRSPWTVRYSRRPNLITSSWERQVTSLRKLPQ